MSFTWKHPSKYKKDKKDKKYFHEVIEEEQKILDIGLKESRRAKKERTESEKMQQELEPINDEVER
jgi:hypothetical protein|tara:strand:- start:301 stop:498 length:198 start_codon:yes stop_codon:yes gene_type:complete